MIACICCILSMYSQNEEGNNNQLTTPSDKMGFAYFNQQEKCNVIYGAYTGSCQMSYIRIPGNILHNLKGKKIEAVDIAYGLSLGTENYLFITPNKPDTNIDFPKNDSQIYIQECTKSIGTSGERHSDKKDAIGFKRIRLDNAYNITGEEPQLYIGALGIYPTPQGEEEQLSRAFCGIRRSENRPKLDGSIYFSYKHLEEEQSKWITIDPPGETEAAIKVIIAGEGIVDYKAMVVSNSNTERYYTADDVVNCLPTIQNLSNEVINSIELEAEAMGQKIQKMIDCSLQPMDVLTIQEAIAFVPTEKSPYGKIKLNIKVAKVNGKSQTVNSSLDYTFARVKQPASANVLIESFGNVSDNILPSVDAILDKDLDSEVSAHVVRYNLYASPNPSSKPYLALIEKGRYPFKNAMFFFMKKNGFLPAIMVDRAYMAPYGAVKPTYDNKEVETNITPFLLKKETINDIIKKYLADKKVFFNINLLAEYLSGKDQIKVNIDIRPLIEGIPAFSHCGLGVILVEDWVKVPESSGRNDSYLYKGVPRVLVDMRTILSPFYGNAFNLEKDGSYSNELLIDTKGKGITDYSHCRVIVFVANAGDPANPFSFNILNAKEANVKVSDSAHKPVDDNATINGSYLNIPSTSNAIIFNMEGQTVLKTDKSCDLSTILTGGVYLIKIGDKVLKCIIK